MDLQAYVSEDCAWFLFWPTAVFSNEIAWGSYFFRKSYDSLSDIPWPIQTVTTKHITNHALIEKVQYYCFIPKALVAQHVLKSLGWQQYPTSYRIVFKRKKNKINTYHDWQFYREDEKEFSTIDPIKQVRFE